MTKHPLELLKHIRDECIFLQENSVELDYEDLLSDEVIKRAFIRSLEVIAEASKSIPDDFKKVNPDLPWREMAGMRDILIHMYTGVDLKVVYNVVKNRIPDLLHDILLLIESEESKSE